MSNEALNVRLFDSEAPAIPDGYLTVSATQSLKINGLPHDVPELKDCQLTLGVRGPQFRLLPQEIAAVYPPPGSAGQYDKVIPHVLLTRSTLPWERSPGGKSTDGIRPWLALIVLHKDLLDVPNQTAELNAGAPNGIYTIQFKDLKKLPSAQFHIPWRGNVSLQPEDDSVQVMKLTWKDANRLLPSWEHLPLLAHVRQANGQSQAAVVANPLSVHRNQPPATDQMSAHLVSLESWYKEDGKLSAPDGNQDSVLLVVLKSWIFASIPEQGATIESIFGWLKEGRGALRLPPTEEAKSNPDAMYFLDRGAVPLPHLHRSGKLTTAFYHGPLAPWKGAGAKDTHFPPITDSFKLKDLVQEHPALGISDLSYAMAYELGRLMLLHDASAARQLLNWKTHAWQMADRGSTSHLPINAGGASASFPDAWFKRLIKLEGVPFAYLVPDERMLPRGPKQETIRFFEVERGWMEALVWGAFSVGPSFGKVVPEDIKKMRDTLFSGIPALRGFLLRSSIVSNWPELHFTVESKSAEGEHLVRRLSADVELHLFPAATTAVTLALPRQALHFEWEPTRQLGKYKSASDLAVDCLYKGHQIQFKFPR